jgi:hypothetical protein
VTCDLKGGQKKEPKGLTDYLIWLSRGDINMQMDAKVSELLKTNALTAVAHVNEFVYILLFNENKYL